MFAHVLQKISIITPTLRFCFVNKRGHKMWFDHDENGDVENGKKINYPFDNEKKFVEELINKMLEM